MAGCCLWGNTFAVVCDKLPVAGTWGKEHQYSCKLRPRYCRAELFLKVSRSRHGAVMLLGLSAQKTAAAPSAALAAAEPAARRCCPGGRAREFSGNRLRAQETLLPALKSRRQRGQWERSWCCALQGQFVFPSPTRRTQPLSLPVLRPLSPKHSGPVALLELSVHVERSKWL